MSLQHWLRSIGGVGYKKGDVDLADDLTGVQNFFNDPYGRPVLDGAGNRIEEVSQLAAMRPAEIDELLARVIPRDKDPISGADRRAPMRDKLCLLYTSPSPRDKRQSRMPSSA